MRQLTETSSRLGDDTFLDALSAGDLLRYRRTSRTSREAVDSYIRRTFRLHKVLSKFLDPAQTEELRVLMSQTGMFISGSVALQFFNRCRYPDCDLDLYLPVHSVQRVSDWIISIGYQLPGFEYEDPKEAILQACRNVRNFKSGFSPSKPRGYNLADLILTFCKAADPKGPKIQLIASFRSHVELVFRFHSSEHKFCCISTSH
jgi:hypothetical protein